MKNLLKIITSISIILISSQAFAQEKIFTTTIKNHKFEPASIEVPANTKFQLIVKNADKTLEEFESHDLRKEKLVGGGKSIKLKMKALKPGKYLFFGEFHPKTAQGMIIAK